MARRAAVGHFRFELISMGVSVARLAGDRSFPFELSRRWCLDFVRKVTIGTRHCEVRPVKNEFRFLMVGDRIG